MSIKPLIVLFNGPPGAGKDTAANVAIQWFGFRKDRNIVPIIEKFAAPIKQICRTIYGVKAFNEHDVFEKKGQPSSTFFGKTCREVQIATSEIFLKVMHGERVFGEMLAKRITDMDNGRGVLVDEHNRETHFVPPKDSQLLFLVSDSGFPDEAKVLIEKFGAENILLIRVHREGHAFAGDSRNYVELVEVESHDIRNTDKDDFEVQIIKTISSFVNKPRGNK